MTIPAGTLRYLLCFHRVENVKDEYGSIKKKPSETPTFKARARRIKNYGGIKHIDGEVIMSQTLNFKIRNNKLFDGNMVVYYDDKEYSIDFYEKDKFDNSIEITLKKTNT